MSAAAKVHYFDTVHNGIAPSKANRSASDILRGSTAPAPVTKEFMHDGVVKRYMERRMKQQQPRAYAALVSSLPRYIKVDGYQANAFAHQELEHFAYMRIGKIDTTYHGQPVRVVISLANAQCSPYFTADGKQSFRNLPPNILDDKAKQTPIYWGHMEDMKGKPIDTHFPDALVFKTDSFAEVVQKCHQVAPKPQAPAARGVVPIAPRPTMDARGSAYAY